jgi:type IV secretion system protein VirB10
MTNPDPGESPVFERAAQMRLRVTQPSSPWNLALGLAFCAVLGVIVFASLSAGRQAKAQNAEAPAAPAATPPVTAAAAPPPVAARPARATVLVPQSATAVPNDPSRRWRSPAMVVDLSDPAAAPVAVAVAGVAPSGSGSDSGVSAEDRFAARVASSDVETAHATRLRDMARVAPQGTLIPAVLETAINSDLPGGVRAVVSQDVRGFDGSTVLIPRGSKLIGQYRNGVALGQSRAFVIWSRILTPEGVSIDVGSPATDPLGRAGLSGETDTHFFARYGGAILLTVMNAGVEAAASHGGSSTAIVIGSATQGPLAGVVPQHANDIPVTVRVAQGSPLQVFVTRDLDFSGLAARR